VNDVRQPVHHHPGFKTEAEMTELFAEKFGKLDMKKTQAVLDDQKEDIPFENWYVEDKSLDEKFEVNEILYGHHEGIQKDGLLSCDHATDAWYRWFLTTPRSQHPMVNPGNLTASAGAYGDTNSFLFQLGNASVYFTTAAPFQKPFDFKRVVMTQKAALLVPVYNVMASKEIFIDASDDDCKKQIEKDLFGIKKISATFDNKRIYGCCVMRTESPIEISNIPKDNAVGIPENTLIRNSSKINAYHGGFWLLFREDTLTLGDHMLTFSAESANYEIDAKILITSLVG
jgi:hypothetical protein